MIEDNPMSQSQEDFFMAKKKDKTYRAGAYKRLSQDDGRGEVSNSIINQTELIKDYGKSHSEIEIVAEYDDDGYSGRTLTAPASCG